MKPADINKILLRSLRRKSPMTIAELTLIAQNVFGNECQRSNVETQLRDMNDLGLTAQEIDPNGILETSWSLTIAGLDVAKKLG